MGFLEDTSSVPSCRAFHLLCRRSGWHQPDSHRGRELPQATFHGGRRTRSRAGPLAVTLPGSLRVWPPLAQHEQCGPEGHLFRLPSPGTLSVAWEALGLREHLGSNPARVPYSAQCATGLISHRSAPASSSPPLLRKELVDRTKRLHTSGELVGLAQFLGKHGTPSIPGSHFHSLKFFQGKCLSHANSLPWVP